jgi:hypothetical protein
MSTIEEDIVAPVQSFTTASIRLREEIIHYNGLQTPKIPIRSKPGASMDYLCTSTRVPKEDKFQLQTTLSQVLLLEQIEFLNQNRIRIE